MRFRFSFRLLAAALLAALLSVVVSGEAVHAQTIDNIAHTKWVFGGDTYETTSNTVSVDVDRSKPVITVYRPTTGSGTGISYRAPRCDTASIASAKVAQQAGNTDAELISAIVETSDKVSPGGSIFFDVLVPVANIDPRVVDSVDVQVISSAGDSERLTIFETGENTGHFIGRILTHHVPPAPSATDCRLGVKDGGTVEIEIHAPGSAVIVATATVDVLADPFGVVFDSETGEEISGARVTLIDAATGQPATVFAEDGITRWPSTVISGQAITDAAGNTYQIGPGEYWFPLTALGSYRVLVEPPDIYTAPSVATPAQLQQLVREDGSTFVIVDGSFGDRFVLVDQVPRRIDIPLDWSGGAVTVAKTASRDRAEPGDAIFYAITVQNPDASRVKRNVVLVDTPSRWLRFRRDSVRVDGERIEDAAQFSADGSELRIELGDIAGGATRRVTYAMTVRPDAPPGDAENRAVAIDSLGREIIAGTSVEIEREAIASRMTIIGRVTAGDCSLINSRRGIPGVRVMLEDGSFAMTDSEGRYHFEGVVPGTHVVQASRMTLPEGGEFVNCHRDTRNAGSATSRFAIGQGGSLVVADFHARLPENALPSSVKTVVETDQGKADAEREGDALREANGPATDWIALGDGPDGWLTPEIGHNPRAPAIRVAIRHRKGQKIALRVDGQPVSGLNFEGTREAEAGKYAVSQWRGIPLKHERTMLSADIINSFGEINETIEREVFFTTAPAKVELVPELSNLVADGRTRPVVAVRVLDRNNRPLREGVAGEFTLSAPYQSAEQIERQQLDQLTGLEASSARWVVGGTDGIALIELAPTMVSGSVRLDFRFDDGEIVREQELETWIVPGDIEWTVIGLAEGSGGARTVAENMERAGRFDSDLGDEARVALYAKGRVLGKYLVTLAYDSAKQAEDQRVLGTLDPDAYYTVFGDASTRRFDAASREKLYLRVETATFYALYGDFETGFDQTRLARYNRTATGVKAEARLGQFRAQGFAAEIATRFRRDEIQGQGITGPYRLSSRGLIANSEKVVLEVRDRFRSELIVSSKELVRFIDYDIDRLSGTITFKEPVLSRDFDLNPQFVVVDYEIDGFSDGELNAGLRTDWTASDGAVRIGATAVTDKGDGSRTDMGAVDLRARFGDSTELRAEVAASRRDGETSTGWLVEAQHQTGSVDVIAYARSLDAEYGVGQQNGAEQGRRKFGTDARIKLGENLSILGSLWQDDSLTDDGRRRAAQIQLGYTTQTSDLRLGIAHFADRLADGTRNDSTVLEGGVTQRLLDNRLELSASTSIALDSAESIDLPARHRIGARYALTENVRIVGLYELADGAEIDARTIKGGLEVTPWEGAKAVTSLGRQDIGEYGNRSFAAFGLAQSLQVTPALTIDATIDGNRTLGGSNTISDVVNPAQPVASGGQLGQDGTLFEDFSAVTLGMAWRKDRWSATGRAEYRDGEFADRKGLTLGAIRQLGEGSIVGSGFTWTEAKADNGAATQIMDAAIAIAHRPAEAALAFLGKLEFRSDEVTDAVAGEAGAAGNTALLVDGDAKSSRLIASLSTNWSPQGRDASGQMVRRHEFGIFIGARHNFDQFEGYDYAGTTLLGGLDAKFGLGERFEIGARGTVRKGLEDGLTSYAIGPNVGFSPADNALITVGYNFAGFRDQDFSAARETDEGLYASIRIKFDADTFSFLRLGR
ncbi:hypothetical protein NCF85_09045 [Qipengyuania citrea]|uniref:DUF11 domain-containing protein n=1 Tax=Qipengyuania citrea TaxID=225971 RepID=A0ABY4U8A3_9SPHN|nr:hypothetical protein [Qipengyuania citrea]USA60260.1 hypothetical protein NCF85_09045 [Qipengyuania citrea]